MYNIGKYVYKGDNKMRDDIIRDSTLKDSSILIPEALKLYKALDIQSVSPITKVAIADFMMIVNSYYSNLIEDIIVNPLEIEKYEKIEEVKSNNEGVAYLIAEKKINERLNRSIKTNLFSREFILFAHKNLYENMENSTENSIVPGKIREIDVMVGSHIPPASEYIKNYLYDFEKAYNLENRDEITSLALFAAAHHRLAWIHPFADGNGRAARLISTAAARKIGIDEGGIWSLPRAICKYRRQYYTMLENADKTDNNGLLNQDGLAKFCKFFLTVCNLEVLFIKNLLEFKTLENNVMRIANSIAKNKLDLAEDLKKILIYVILKGEIVRGKIPELLNKPERTTRDITKKLIINNLLKSVTPKSPLRLNLPVKYGAMMFPGIFPYSLERDIIESD